MPYKLTLDFVGMVVVVKDATTGHLSVGCLDEPGHVHTIHYCDENEHSRIAALKVRCPGANDIRTDSNAATSLAANGRLLDMATIAPAKSKAVIFDYFTSRFDLYGGELAALPAHVGDDQSTWRMPGTAPTFLLTDRLRFTGTVASDPFQIGGVSLRLKGGEIHGIVSAIDGDYGSRNTTLEEGFPLTEFAHFYRLTTAYGGIPMAVPRRARVNPDMPICPGGFVTTK